MPSQLVHAGKYMLLIVSSGTCGCLALHAAVMHDMLQTDQHGTQGGV